MARPFKKAFADAAHVAPIDETGLLLNPLVRRTWAPKGKTPVLESWGGHRKKVSVIGAVTLSPISRRLGFYFATQVDGYFDTAEKVVDCLRDLLKHLRGRVVVVWDGGPNHKGPARRDVLRRNRRPRLERLPAYGPHLNPVEAVWSWLKYGQLANFVPSGLVDLDDRILDRLIELRFDPASLRKSWDASDLPFPEPLKCKSG